MTIPMEEAQDLLIHVTERLQHRGLPHGQLVRVFRVLKIIALDLESALEEHLARQVPTQGALKAQESLAAMKQSLDDSSTRLSDARGTAIQARDRAMETLKLLKTLDAGAPYSAAGSPTDPAPGSSRSMRTGHD